MKFEKFTPTAFAKIAFGWIAFLYQINPLNDISKRVLIASGRQIGKTEIAAIKGLFFAVTRPNSTVLIIAPTQRQANILFAKIKLMLNRNSRMDETARLPITELITRETRTEIEFDNGSKLVALPAAEDGANIRGYSADVIILDEAGYFDDRVFHAILPMLVMTKGMLMMIGTPKGVDNFFYRVYSDKKFGFNSYHFTSYQNPKHDKSMIELHKGMMADIEFRQEYLGEFIETVGVMFPLKLVESVIKDYSVPNRVDPEKQFSYYLGADPARFGDDEGVMVIVEKIPGKTDDYLKVVDIIAFKGKSLAEQVRMIRDLHHHWKFAKIIIDATGMGGGVVDPLVEEGLPVDGFNFSLHSKQEAYFNMKRIMETGNLILPTHDKLKKELLEMKMEQTKDASQYKIHPPSGGHDDFPDALALACWAMKKKTVPVLFATAEKEFFAT